MYNPSIGRWMEEDPIDFKAGDADKYRYTGNNPTDATDPSGLDWTPAGVKKYLQLSAVGKKTLRQLQSGKPPVFLFSGVSWTYRLLDVETGKPKGEELAKTDFTVKGATDPGKNGATVYISRTLTDFQAAITLVDEMAKAQRNVTTGFAPDIQRLQTSRSRLGRSELESKIEKLMLDTYIRAEVQIGLDDEVAGNLAVAQFLLEAWKNESFKMEARKWSELDQAASGGYGPICATGPTPLWSLNLKEFVDQLRSYTTAGKDGVDKAQVVDKKVAILKAAEGYAAVYTQAAGVLDDGTPVQFNPIRYIGAVKMPGNKWN
jgi:hypothetical protein